MVLAKKKKIGEMRKDCFGYHAQSDGCRILSEDICRFRKCSFFKTPEEYEKGRVGGLPSKFNSGIRKGRV